MVAIDILVMRAVLVLAVVECAYPAICQSQPA